MFSKKRKKLGNILILIFIVLAFIFINRSILGESSKKTKILVNVSTGKKIELVKDPSKINEDNIFKKLNEKTFELSSQKGNWHYTFKIISENGEFEGEYEDLKSNQKLLSEFKGKFIVVEKLDDLTYKVMVEKIEQKLPSKKQKGVKYVYPNHFKERTQYILRLPNTKTYSLIDGYEKHDFQDIITDRLNVYTFENAGFVYYEKVK